VRVEVVSVLTDRCIYNGELDDAIKSHGKIFVHSGASGGSEPAMVAASSVIQDKATADSVPARSADHGSTMPSKPIFSVMDEARPDSTKSSKVHKQQKMSAPPGANAELPARGTWQTVLVQYVRSPGYFVVQYEQDLPKIEQLSVEIGLKCDNQPLRAITDKQLQPGMLLLAKRRDDGKWYRACVTRILGHQLEVELIDFGSLICVSATDG